MNGKRIVAAVMVAVLMCGAGVSVVLAEQAGQAASAVVYTCPMHPEVVSNESGKCPKCGMDLVAKAAAPAEKKAKKAPAKYVCSMCPDVASDKPGKCPKCGMKLEKKKLPKDKELKPCPNCVDESNINPGACPTCGIPVKRFSGGDEPKK